MYRKITIMSENDVRIAVNFVRCMGVSLQFSPVDVQKLMVTVSELTQNIIDHANSDGFIILEMIEEDGIKITVQDFGSGISQLDEILQGNRNFERKGLGLGLLGARRLMDDFFIETSKEGTKIIAIKRKDTDRAKY